ncbi:MAG: helix-turn-helix transcriptional regulator [Clostridia bacterium]|nr:helix-turn-helix transcriptional regulator [Clostridia bacterium]
MKINTCDINLVHDKTFIINRPMGSGDNLFIYTRTPIILITDGNMKRYPAETTVFFRKGQPQHFMAAGHLYADDFIHFDANEEEMAWIDSLGIPSGVPFPDLDASIFLNLHRYICVERHSKTAHREESINLLLRYFLIKLAQAMEEAKAIPLNSSAKNAIRELRYSLYTNVDQAYTIDELAAKVGLSASYFQATYKKMFGRSCMDDIIHARIERAKALLLQTDLPVSAVARMCGYESDSHFSRQFKKHVRMTPVAFRGRKGTQGGGTDVFQSIR